MKGFVPYFCAGIFAALSALHLAAAAAGANKICAWTKGFLMPLLALSAALLFSRAAPLSAASSRALAVVCAALALGCAGDILLIKTGDKFFMAGAACFLAGHVFWISQYARDISRVSPLFIAIGAIAMALALFGEFNLLGRPKTVLGFCAIVYGAFLCALVFTGAAALSAERGSAPLMYLAGGVLFLVSDTMLGFTFFRGNFPLHKFFVMATYIAAQTLLTAGSLLRFRAW